MGARRAAWVARRGWSYPMTAPPPPPFRPSTEPRRQLRAEFHLLDEAAPGAAWSVASAQIEVRIPLTAEEAVALEVALQQQLLLPLGHTVFAVRPLAEPAAPAVPLLLLHGLVAPQESELAASVIVRPLAQLQQPRRLEGMREPIPLDRLLLGGADGAAAAAELLRRLQCHGTACVRGSTELTAATRAAYRALPGLFALPAPYKRGLWQPMAPQSTARRDGRRAGRRARSRSPSRCSGR